MKVSLIFATIAVCWYIKLRRTKNAAAAPHVSSTFASLLSRMLPSHIKAVAIDLDGTLLSSHHTISQETQNVLSQIYEAGIHVIVATGRTLAECMQWTPLLPPVVRFASCNGAHIADWKNGECTVRLKRVLQPCVALSLVEILIKNNIRFCLFELGHAYVSKKEDVDILLEDATKVSFCEDFSIHEKSENIMSVMIPIHNQPHVLALTSTSTSANTATDISPLPNTHSHTTITTTSVSSTPTPSLPPALTRAQILAQAATPIVSMLNSLPLQDMGIQVIQSSTSSGQGSYIDIISVHAGKEAALREMCGDLNIQMDQIISFGDSDNDLGMLRATGWSVTPSNGNTNAKNAAKMVSQWSNDEDCVRRELQCLLDACKK